MPSGYSLYSFCRYTTFGSPMPSRSFSASSYRYGFNGQEKDDEVSGSGNSNTAEYWQYDTRLGKRWNIDPENMPWLSNYHAFDNNPILNKDVRGNTFEGAESKANAKAATEKGEKRKTAITARQGDVDKSLDGLTAIKDPNKDQKKEIRALTAEKKYLAEALTEVTASIAEIDEMANSPQKFELLASNDVKKGGATVYRKDPLGGTGTVVMFFNPQSATADVHELKHGHQFLKGKQSFSNTAIDEIGGVKFQAGGVLTEKTDEVEAYKRSYAFDPSKPQLKNPDFNFIDTDWVQDLGIYDNLLVPEKNLGNTTPQELGDDIIFNP